MARASGLPYHCFAPFIPKELPPYPPSIHFTMPSSTVPTVYRSPLRGIILSQSHSLALPCPKAHSFYPLLATLFKAVLKKKLYYEDRKSSSCKHAPRICIYIFDCSNLRDFRARGSTSNKDTRSEGLVVHV